MHTTTPPRQLELKPLLAGTHPRHLYLERARFRDEGERAIALADVVVVDDADAPTIAVALFYNREFLAAPLVAASAAGGDAHDVLSIAAAFDVPVVPQPAVARELAGLELGDEIEPAMYTVIAKILISVRALPA